MAATIAVDANVIVRYLTGDDKVQSEAAAELFRTAQAGRIKLVVPASTIQETVYVLEKLYDLGPAAIASKLISLLSIQNVNTPHAGWVVEALQFYREKNCDFGDALLCAFAQSEGCDVATFDKGIVKKVPEIKARTPVEWTSGKTHGREDGRQN